MNAVRQSVNGSELAPAHAASAPQSAAGQTLPLFAELEPAAGRQRAADLLGAERSLTGGAGTQNSNRHLAAAIRLSRSMRRLRDHSPEQTRTGQAICRHLQALLKDTPCG